MVFHISTILLLQGMVEQAKLAYASLDMISYAHIVSCEHPHTTYINGGKKEKRFRWDKQRNYNHYKQLPI
jgi:hypothetical protein